MQNGITVFLCASALAGYITAQVPTLGTQLTETLDRIDQLWLYHPSDHALSQMVQGYVATDPHASVLTTQQTDALERVTQGQRGGIGVLIAPHPLGVVVTEAIAGMPAAQAGVLAGDVITHIDGNPLPTNTPFTHALGLLEGSIGTTVALKLYRDGTDRQLSLTRASLIDYQACYQKIGSVGVITVHFFDAPSHDHMVQALTALNGPTDPCQAYIIDLRDAYGGLVTSAIQAATLWVPHETIIAKIYQKQHKPVIHRNAARPLVPATTPLIILANEQTASAAELFASALREQARAIIIGSRTFGKATIQSIIRPNSYCTVKITTGTIKSGKGITWEGAGLSPDLDTRLPAGLEGRLLVANAVDALLAQYKTTPSGRTLIKQLAKRLPGQSAVSLCTHVTR